MRMCLISLFSLFSIALAGCGASQVKIADITNSPPLEPKEIESLSTPLPTVPTQDDGLPKMPKDPTLPIPRSPGLQALIERAKADLSQRLSIQTSRIKVIGTKETAWPNTSLGCPQPGINYVQIPTPGYIVILEYAGNEFEYHVGIHGNVLLCKNPTPPISGTPADIFPFNIQTP